MDALLYVLENTHVHVHIQGIILHYASEMVNSHFVDNSLFSLGADEEVIANARDSLSIFFHDFWDSFLLEIHGSKCHHEIPWHLIW